MSKRFLVLLASTLFLLLFSSFFPLVNQVDRGWYMCQLNTDPMRSQKGYIEVQGTYVLLDCINATKSNSYNTTSHNLFHLFLKVLTFCIGLQQCTINDHILQSYSTIIRSYDHILQSYALYDHILQSYSTIIRSIRSHSPTIFHYHTITF